MRYAYTERIERFARADMLKDDERLAPQDRAGQMETMALQSWRELDMDGLCAEAAAAGLAVEIDVHWPSTSMPTSEPLGYYLLPDHRISIAVRFPDYRVMAPITEAAKILSNRFRGTNHTIYLAGSVAAPERPFHQLEERMT